MGKYEEAAVRTKRNLTKAFWSLYTQVRMEKISVKEITARAGYNRSTFYEYFTDVYDVLEQLEDSLLPDLLELPPPNLSTAPEEVIDTYLLLFEAHSEYYRVLLGANGDAHFASRLKDGVKARVLSVLPAVDERTDYALEMLLSAMIGVLAHWYERGQDYPKEELVRLISGFIENGVSLPVNPFVPGFEYKA
jgi:AcrR family transcriptional regulator